MPPLLADFIYGRVCELKCEKFLTRPYNKGLLQNRILKNPAKEKVSENRRLDGSHSLLHNFSIWSDNYLLQQAHCGAVRQIRTADLILTKRKGEFF